MEMEEIEAITFTVHILLRPIVFCRFLNRNWFDWINGLVVHVCSKIYKELDWKPVEIGNNWKQMSAGRWNSALTELIILSTTVLCDAKANDCYHKWDNTPVYLHQGASNLAPDRLFIVQ